MPVITVSSLKGGVGKTTISLHLAHGLARAGYQTLLIDCDLSCHVSRFLGVDFKADSVSGVACLLRSADKLGIKQVDGGFCFSSIPHSLLRTEVREKLDLIPGSPGLRSEKSLTFSADMEFLLANSIKHLSRVYPFIVIDTGPELNLLTRNALRAASLILIPTDGSMMSIDSFADLLNFDQDIPSHASRCVIRNMVSRSASRTSALSDSSLRERIEMLAGEFGKRSGYRVQTRLGILETIIRKAEALHQLSFMKRTAFDHSSYAPISSNFMELVQEILYISMLDDAVPHADNADSSSPH